MLLFRVTARSALSAVGGATVAVCDDDFEWDTPSTKPDRDAMLVTIPVAFSARRATRFMVPDEPGDATGLVQLIVPLAPTAGVEQDQIPEACRDTKVRPSGRVSVTVIPFGRLTVEDSE